MITITPDWEMGLEPEPMDRMEEGIKTMELRLDKGKWQLMLPGQTIAFLREPLRATILYVRIVNLVRFSSFAALLDRYDPEEYFGRDRSTMLRRLLKPTGRYEVAEEKRLGVLGIIIEPLPKPALNL